MLLLMLDAVEDAFGLFVAAIGTVAMAICFTMWV